MDKDDYRSVTHETNPARGSLGKAVAGALRGKTQYVDDYQLEETTDSRGRRKTVARYIGQWTVVTEREEGAKRKLFLTLALCIFTPAAAAATQFISHTAASAWYVQLPQLFALFPALYMLMGAAKLPYRLKPMRRDEYMKGMIRVSRSAVGVIAFETAAAAAGFVYRHRSGESAYSAGDAVWLCLLGAAILCSVGAILVLGRLEISQRTNSYYEEVLEL